VKVQLKKPSKTLLKEASKKGTKAKK
jgi:hypothetical protein